MVCTTSANVKIMWLRWLQMQVNKRGWFARRSQNRRHQNLYVTSVVVFQELIERSGPCVEFYRSEYNGATSINPN